MPIIKIKVDITSGMVGSWKFPEENEKKKERNLRFSIYREIF